MSGEEVKKEGLRKEPSGTEMVTERREATEGDQKEAGREAEEPGDVADGPRRGPRGRGIWGSGLRGKNSVPCQTQQAGPPDGGLMTGEDLVFRTSRFTLRRAG